jgi:hypothetical protein
MQRTIRLTCDRNVSLIAGLVVLVGLLAVPAADAASHGEIKGGRLIVSPRAGAVVETNTASIGIRSGGGLRVRLNRHWIPASEFGRARHGVRRLQASLSQGLRPGRNYLTVRMRRNGKARRATLRFWVNASGPLVGAGTDQSAAVGSDVQLSGDVEPGGASGPIGWTPIRTPEGNPSSCQPSSAATQLRSPAGTTAEFEPDLPGEYVYRLTEGKGADAVSDTVPVEVTYPNRMVPIDTIVSPKFVDAGIKVGPYIYRRSQATIDPQNLHPTFQVLVLERGTLECVSNTLYSNAPELKQELDKLDSSKLVIVAMQPSGTSAIDGRLLYDALGRIGFPEEKGKALPKGPGAFSGIGVPGMPRGDADVNVLNDAEFGNKTGELGNLSGYLIPDQHGNYGYVPKLSESFRYSPEPFAPCKEEKECEGFEGYFLQIQNPRSGKTLSEQIYTTGVAKEATEQTEALVKKIESIPEDDVVRLISDSDRTVTEGTFPPSLGKVGQALYDKLVKAVESIGGTRNGFNRTAQTRGSIESNGQTYVLVGWKGAKEGEGAEAAAGVFGQGDVPHLIGELRPDRRSLLKPALEGEVATGTNLAKVLMWQPEEKWPLAGNAAAMRAFAYLGETNSKLGAEPRTAYWSLEFTPAKWESFATAIKKIEWEKSEAKKFGRREFLEAREELVTELNWVANVREYVKHLSEPFTESVFPSWSEATTIGDRIYEEAKANSEDTTFEWTEFTSILLKLAGPLTFHLTNTFGEILDLEVWAYGATADGLPTYDTVAIKSNELGDELAKQMTDAAKTYKAMADVIVSDPKKLKIVGEEGGCNPASAKCDKEFAFTKEDERAIGADLSRSIERVAYEKLLPTSYFVYRLNRDASPEKVGGKPRNPVDYICGEAVHPWGNYSQIGRQYAFGTLLEHKDVENGGNHNVWQNLVLGLPKKPFWLHDEPPADKVLERMFGKVSRTSDPNADGLGISSEELLANQRPNWKLWEKGVYDEDRCAWGE